MPIKQNEIPFTQEEIGRFDRLEKILCFGLQPTISNIQLANDQCGSFRIDNRSFGKGSFLVFTKIPNNMSGTILEELCGLEGKYKHPLWGTVYFTETIDHKHFELIIFQHNTEMPISEAFVSWFMKNDCMQYVSEETREKLKPSARVQ